MSLLGAWVGNRIVKGVVQNAAHNAAHYLVGFIEPHVQELSSKSSLGAVSREKLDALVGSTMLRSKNFVSIKLWGRDGTLFYSNDKSLIGKVFEPGQGLIGAWEGKVIPEYNELEDDESKHERAFQMPMLEIYAPVRRTESSEIIAVAEIYEIADKLAFEVRKAYFETALGIAMFSLVLIGSLFHIVWQGSRTIAEQQRSLAQQVDQLSVMLDLNQRLRARVTDATKRASEANETFLRRIGAELHDGPVQLISLGLLRVSSLKPEHAKDASAARESHQIVQKVLADALTEIRQICAGMSLPELEKFTVARAISHAVQCHEMRTRTNVDLSLASDIPGKVSRPYLTAIYRCVQEGLNNSFKHAGACGQRVSARVEGDEFVVTVSDSGPGFSDRQSQQFGSGLGLSGNRDRIVSLGGELDIDTDGDGTHLAVRFKLEQLSLSGNGND